MIYLQSVALGVGDGAESWPGKACIDLQFPSNTCSIRNFSNPGLVRLALTFSFPVSLALIGTLVFWLLGDGVESWPSKACFDLQFPSTTSSIRNFSVLVAKSIMEVSNTIFRL